MSSENRLPFTVRQVLGGLDTYSKYGEQATKILSLAYPEIATTVPREVKGDLSDHTETIFLLMLDDLLVGFSSYKQIYICPVREREQKHFSWTPSQWSENQSQTASARWTAIHPDFQHRGGWKQMMDTYDASLMPTNFRYQVRQVRKANDYAEKVRARYKDHVLFEADVDGYGPQTYFRIRIPRE